MSENTFVTHLKNMDFAWLALIAFLLLVLVMLFFVFSYFLTLFYDAPFVPLHKKDIQFLQKKLVVRAGEHIYDLGSGDGRVLCALVSGDKIFGMGIERSFLLRVISRRRAKACSISEKNLVFRSGNFYKHKISDADHVVCYLFPKAMEKLATKFDQELKHGTMIYSFSFSIPEWEPIETCLVDGPGSKRLYIYRKEP